MERTYVFNQEPSSGGGNKFDIMAMLPNLMGGKGVDPNLMALLSQGRNNQDQWGGSWWFIWIILLWFCWGGNGFGGIDVLRVLFLSHGCYHRSLYQRVFPQKERSLSNHLSA